MEFKEQPTIKIVEKNNIYLINLITDLLLKNIIIFLIKLSIERQLETLLYAEQIVI